MSGWIAVCMRFPRLTLAALVILAVTGGVLLAASGAIPIKASSGHWSLTEWFLEFSMRRSVSTHAMLTDDPPADLDSMARVLRGAGYYETGCRPCHGAPGDRLPPITKAMTPPPPILSPRVLTWAPHDLFYIVKHGVKFTGMPAWPTQARDDEVWDMVAFLRRLPSLDLDAYGRLVGGGGTSLTEMFAGTVPAESAPELVQDLCVRCHGMDGNGRGAAAFPKIGGQRLGYLIESMDAFATGRRHSGVMQAIAAGLEKGQRDGALRYYASKTMSASQHAPADAVARGETIAHHGVPARDVPACASCHGPAEHTVSDAYPRLAGQYAGYIAQQLRLFQQRRRGGSEYVHIMHSFVDRLTPEQIDDVAAYYSVARE